MAWCVRELSTQSSRPPRWLFGEGVGVQVWEVDGHPDQHASVMIGAEGTVVLINRLIVGTPDEYGAISWALERVTVGAPGFYVRIA